MKRHVIGDLIINYLVNCKKGDVDTRDLIKAVAPGCNEEDLYKAFDSILPVLTKLESGGLVKLSAEAIPSTNFMPKVIHILPKMKQAADKLVQDKTSEAKANPRPEGRRQKGGQATVVDGGKKHSAAELRRDAIQERYEMFYDLFEKNKNQLRIGSEWGRLISSMSYNYIEEEPGFDACIRSFVNGIIYRVREETVGPRPRPAGKAPKEEPAIRPEIQRVIEDIIKAVEQKNGPLKNGRRYRRAADDADAPLLRLEREEIRDFMRCLRRMREGAQPNRIWRDSICRFITELLQNMPVYEATMESFRAGVAFQTHRKKLESQH